MARTDWVLFLSIDRRHTLVQMDHAIGQYRSIRILRLITCEQRMKKATPNSGGLAWRGTTYPDDRCVRTLNAGYRGDTMDQSVGRSILDSGCTGCQIGRIGRPSNRRAHNRIDMACNKEIDSRCIANSNDLEHASNTKDRAVRSECSSLECQRKSSERLPAENRWQPTGPW